MIYPRTYNAAKFLNPTQANRQINLRIDANKAYETAALVERDQQAEIVASYDDEAKRQCGKEGDAGTLDGRIKVLEDSIKTRTNKKRVLNDDKATLEEQNGLALEEDPMTTAQIFSIDTELSALANANKYDVNDLRKCLEL